MIDIAIYVFSGLAILATLKAAREAVLSATADALFKTGDSDER